MTTEVVYPQEIKVHEEGNLPIESNKEEASLLI